MNKVKKRVCAFYIKILAVKQSNKEFIMKKEMFLMTAILMTGLLVAACGSTGGGGTASSGSSAAISAPLGAEGVPQPDWVRKGKAETGDTVYFVGEGRSGTTTTAKKGTARRDADAQVARWVGAKVDQIMKDFVEESGETGNTQSLESFRDAVRTTASANVSSLKEDETWVAGDGRYVILFSYSKEAFKNDFKKEFQRNKSAVFANYEADKMFELMDKNLVP